MRERIKANSSACYHCAARKLVESEYICDETALDSRSLNLRVARYAPLNCPRGIGRKSSSQQQVLPEILLRKLLNK